MTYYIDPLCGSDEQNGFTPDTPKADYSSVTPNPGDRILFRRGTVIRGCLYMRSGTENEPVYYGAYGDGNAPVFCGSVDVSNPADWTEVRRNIWEYSKPLDSEVCNFIFDGCRTGSCLRWNEEDLCEQGDFYDSRMGMAEAHKDYPPQKVLLWSDGNPGRVYSHIECAVFGKRTLCPNVNCTVIEDIAFFGSGVHAISGPGHDITVRRCIFMFIGGSVWNRKLRIRFGNAIEFWNIGKNITIENCYFDNIYDSCITQQGGIGCTPAENIVMRGNLFRNYGMGAYEGRDMMPVGCVFEDNICLYAGGGFSAFGDTRPRNSEIYPQPMGHHIFMWRINAPSDGGSFTVRNNLFHEASGGAVYAIISDDADAQMTLSGNTYFTSNRDLLILRRSRCMNTEDYRSSGCEKDAVFDEKNVGVIEGQWIKKHLCM